MRNLHGVGATSLHENQNDAATGFDVRSRWGTGEQNSRGAVRDIHLQQPPLRGPFAIAQLCPIRTGLARQHIQKETNVTKVQLNHVHCEPSFTEAELESLHPRVPCMPPLPPERAVRVAWRGGRVKIRTAARQPPVTRTDLFTPVSRMMIHLAE